MGSIHRFSVGIELGCKRLRLRRNISRLLLKGFGAFFSYHFEK